MALSLSISFCQSDGCKTLTITDDTGEYSGLNQTGWGTPNIELADVSVATITITDPDDVAHVIDLVNDLGIDYLTATADTLEYDIANTYFGLGTDDKITDGIYNILYSITDTSLDVYTIERNIAIYCNIACQINDLLKMIPEQYSCNKCNTAFINEVFECYMMYKALINAAECGSVSEFNNILAMLKKMINNAKYGL